MADADEENENVNASLDEGEEGGGEDNGEEEKKGGLGTKKIILFVVLPLLLLGGGAAAAYMTGMFGGGDEAATEDGGHGEEASGDHGGGHGDGHGGGHAGGPVFLEIPAQLVNLSPGKDGIERALSLRVQLQLKNPADKEKVEAIMPRLIDKFQIYLRELRVQDLRGSMGPRRLTAELLNRVNAAAHPVEVEAVLIQEMLIQ